MGLDFLCSSFRSGARRHKKEKIYHYSTIFGALTLVVYFGALRVGRNRWGPMFGPFS